MRHTSTTAQLQRGNGLIGARSVAAVHAGGDRGDERERAGSRILYTEAKLHRDDESSIASECARGEPLLMEVLTSIALALPSVVTVKRLELTITRPMPQLPAW